MVTVTTSQNRVQSADGMKRKLAESAGGAVEFSQLFSAKAAAVQQMVHQEPSFTVKAEASAVRAHQEKVSGTKEDAVTVSEAEEDTSDQNEASAASNPDQAQALLAMGLLPVGARTPYGAAATELSAQGGVGSAYLQGSGLLPGEGPLLTGMQVSALNLAAGELGMRAEGAFAQSLQEQMLQTMPLTEASVPTSDALAMTGAGAVANSLQTASANSAPSIAAVSTDATVRSQLGTAAWSREIGQKVVWMVGGPDQSATLTLNPPDLGPLKVVIQVSNASVDATFVSDNPNVRQALEDGLDNLRNSLNQSGLSLGQTQVQSGGDQTGQSPQNRADGSATRRGNGVANDVDAAHANGIRSQVVNTNQRAVNGLVDTFA